MSTKTSARTRITAEPTIRSSGRNGRTQATKVASTIELPPGSASNGTAPANAPAKPTTVPREPSDFVLRTAFREFAAEHPEQTDVNELTAAFIKTLTNAQMRLGLHQVIRSYLVPQVLQYARQRDWGMEGTKQSPTRSARNDVMRAAVADGSLDEYRKIVDAELLLKGSRKRLGSLTLSDVELLIDVREQLAKGAQREAKFFKHVHEQMRVTAARTIDDLDHRWLVVARGNV